MASCHWSNNLAFSCHAEWEEQVFPSGLLFKTRISELSSKGQSRFHVAGHICLCLSVALLWLHPSKHVAVSCLNSPTQADRAPDLKHKLLFANPWFKFSIPRTGDVAPWHSTAYHVWCWVLSTALEKIKSCYKLSKCKCTRCCSID